MANYRLYYAIQALAIGPEGTALNSFSATHFAHGVQSVGINTNFNLEQIFELGMISIYANLENIPSVEITAQKVLDGYCPLYLLATRGAASTTLAGRSNVKSSAALYLFNDNNDSSSGVPIAACVMSGMFPQQIAYSMNVDGPFTENLTLVGNNKVWSFAGISAIPAAVYQSNADFPLAGDASGNVNRRKDFIWVSTTGIVGLDVNGQVAVNDASVFPSDVDGITSSGTNQLTGGIYGCHAQSVDVSTNLGRTELFELGRFGPYYRFANFPVEVTCAISVISVRGDNISATEAGILGNGNNLANRTIKVQCREGLYIDLGKKNKLSGSSESVGNAGTGGGNVTVTYNYSNFNDMAVYHPQDVSALARPSA